MEDVQNRLRVTQIRAVDSFAHAIVEVAGRTALYNYDQSGETWSKTDVEGTLMIYTRSCKPKHMITIINKNSKVNFTEPITRNCDAQLKAPYVLLRNDSKKILGIWFAEQSDVPRIYEAIGKFIRIEEQLNSAPACNPVSSQPTIVAFFPETSKQQISTNSTDIMSMLSRAHGEFETKKGDGGTDVPSAAAAAAAAAPKANTVDKHLGKSADVVKPSSVKLVSLAALKTAPTTNMNEDITLNSQQPPHNNTVADFFAKVGLGPQRNSNNTLNKSYQHLEPTREPTATNSSSSYSSSKGNAATAPASNNCNANPMLAQMFQGAAAVGGQASVDNNNCIGSNPVAIPQVPHEAPVQTGTPSSATVVETLKKPGKPAPMSLQELEGKLRENLTVTGSSSSGSHDSYIPFNDLLLGASPSTSKSNLIAPQMFTIGKSLIDDLSPINNSVQESPGVQPLFMAQDENSLPRRAPPYNNNEMNTVPFRIIPQTPPGLTTTSRAANSSIQNILMSNSYNNPNSINNNNSIINRKPSSEMNRRTPNINDLSLLDSPPPGMPQPSQQPSQQGVQQDRQRMLLTQDQFVTALTHALTKDDFVKQLYQAYEEAVQLKSAHC